MTSKAQRLSGLAKELDALAAASSSTLVVYEYTATANQTVFSGPDNNGLTLNYIQANTLVMYNEGVLQKVVDYTTTSTSVLTLLLGAEVGALVRVYAFGTFAVANVYTKAETEVLVNNTKVGRGYIDGLSITYTSRKSLTIGAGSLYIPSLDRVITLPNDITLTNMVFTANTFHHVYLYESGGVAAVEYNTVLPVKYFGTAYTKTGDASRRYIGSVLVNQNSEMWTFRHFVSKNEIQYLEGTPIAAPFLITDAWGGTTPSTQPTNAVCPVVTATHLHAGIQSVGLAYFYSYEQSAVGSASQFVTVVGVNTTAYLSLCDIYIPLARSGVNIGAYLVSAQGGAPGAYVSTFAYGYIFER